MKSALTILLCRLTTLICSSRGPDGAAWRPGNVGRSVEVVLHSVEPVEERAAGAREGGEGEGMRRGTASSSEM